MCLLCLFFCVRLCMYGFPGWGRALFFFNGICAFPRSRSPAMNPLFFLLTWRNELSSAAFSNGLKSAQQGRMSFLFFCLFVRVGFAPFFLSFVGCAYSSCRVQDLFVRHARPSFFFRVGLFFFACYTTAALNIFFVVVALFFFQSTNRILLVGFFPF